MRTRTRSTTLLGAVSGAALLGGLVSAPASAAGGQGMFVVDTQFWNKPNQVVYATGPYAGCTTVRDLEIDGEQTATNQATFSGTKQIKCGGDSTTIGYEATVTVSAGGTSSKTQGTWWTVSATSPSLQGLGGSLTGDYSQCTVAKGSGGCVLDTFRVTG